MKNGRISRRKFLQLTAMSVAAATAGNADLGESSAISLILDPADSLASMPSVSWAVQELSDSLSQPGVTVRQFASVKQAPRSDLCVIVSGPASAAALLEGGIRVPSTPESLVLAPASHLRRKILVACGTDARGLMYAVLELADRVRHGESPREAISSRKAIVEEPFNQVRSIGRLFVSDIEDKPWFNDREMWPAYFSMLATQRINRFSLNMGIGFDNLQHVTDSYFLFAYPFLLHVPGYEVRALNLPDAERDRNLEMLQFISRQAVIHGIDFQLGIWTHGYQWTDTPNSNYTIEGLTPDNHAAYSRDALTALLKACPDIRGITLRTHGESGVREGSYEFWKTVFEGVARCGRKVEIDLHPKGLDQKLLDSALATGMPIKLSPKYWAEHMGLPYQQAAIRELEMPRENATGGGEFYALSTGSRVFTRYGYADFLHEDRPYSLIYRIWPGTHRFLLWGDPVSTAAHARAFRFCGSNGVELYEPLSFKGRRGSGIPGSRCGYADSSLNPVHDWEKYLYTYRVWGRLLYNPNADPDVWRRKLRKDFNASAPAVEAALGSATRIVPLITTAHLPSAANDTYGPEFYTNQSIVDPAKYSPYGDTPAPKIFGNVSPLDPELFGRINDFVAEMLKGEHRGKHSPIDVARWLENLASIASVQLSKADKGNVINTPEFRRMATDVKIQIGIGRFFAAKLRSGTLYGIHAQSGDREALESALKLYREARDIWSQLANDASSVYVSDLTYGPRPYQRGSWLDRLPAIDDDIATMAKQLESVLSGSAQPSRVSSAIEEASGHREHASIRCKHIEPQRFTPNVELQITLRVEKTSEPIAARLYYRHVNQAERYQSVDMRAERNGYVAAIPAGYTDSAYPLQYYFEIRQRADKAFLYPGLGRDLAIQPYFVVRRA